MPLLSTAPEKAKLGALIVSEGLSDPSFLTTAGQAAENAGLDSLWLADHIVIPHTYQSQYPYSPDGRLTTPPYPDPLTTLGYLAAVTKRIELGTAVLVLPQRNPIIVAKQAATLHQLSGGRLRLGVGVGWLREEFEVLGADFASRGARTDEYLEVMKLLWRSEAPIFDGKYVTLNGSVSIEPRPQESISLIIGGHSPAAARRAGRLGDGLFPLTQDVDILRDLYSLAIEEAARAGRPDGAVQRLAMGGLDVDQASVLLDAGVQHLILPVAMKTPDPGVLVERLQRLGAFRAEVVSK
jgi:probable F420-dependent oxidoreductase